jgi:hypothetical protein
MTRSLLSLCSLLTLTAAAHAQEFEKPIRLQAGGKPVDTDIGHAHPLLYDFDHDGKRDLLVGQFGEGKLRIHKNVGTNEAPRFAEHTWFMAGGEIAKVAAS